MLEAKIKNILNEIKNIKNNDNLIGKMPQNTYFMKNGDVLCMERECGECRYPYSNDGYILWAHSSGYIHAKSGMFNVFKP